MIRYLKVTVSIISSAICVCTVTYAYAVTSIKKIKTSILNKAFIGISQRVKTKYLLSVTYALTLHKIVYFKSGIEINFNI